MIGDVSGSGLRLASGTGAVLAPTTRTAKKTELAIFMESGDGDGCCLTFDVGVNGS